MRLLFEPPFRRNAPPLFPLLVIITVIGSIATHMIVPALPVIAKSLDASAGAIQMTITLFLGSMAIGQLMYGPLSDRIGRRPLVLAGLLLYVVSCVLAASAASIGQLLAARVIQALGACSGVVLGRAILRDGTAPEKMAGLMSVMITFMTIGPAMAPVLGGYLTAWFGWRFIFWLMAVLGAITLLAAILTLPETHRNRTSLQGIGAMLGTYRQLMRRPVFLGNAIGGCCISTSLYAFFAASPFILVDVLHQPVEGIGVYFLMVMFSATAGGIFASRLSRHFGARQLAMAASWLQIAGAALLLAADLAGHLNVATLVGPVMLIGFAGGFGSPMAITGAVNADPRAIGAASGLYGFMQMVFGVLCTLVVSMWHTASALPVGVVLMVAAVAGIVAFARVSNGPPDVVAPGRT